MLARSLALVAALLIALPVGAAQAGKLRKLALSGVPILEREDPYRPLDRSLVRATVVRVKWLARGSRRIEFKPINGIHVALWVRLPRSIAIPFKRGDEVQFAIGIEGGGPHSRLTLVVCDAAGHLLLAIGQRSTAVPGFAIDYGSVVKTTPSSATIHRRLAVALGHGDDHVDVSGWARWRSGGDWFVYGAAGSSERRVATDAPPPDFVARWLDFAIVRIPDGRRQIRTRP